MNKINNKTRASEIAKSAKQAPAQLIEAAVVEKVAPKKPTTRADVLSVNAVAFDNIAEGDIILFDDKMHAQAKNVPSMLKYARVLSRTKTRIFGIVDNAPYVLDKALCEKFGFVFAKCADDAHATKTHEFTNVAITVRNLVNSAEYFRDFLKHEKIVAFTSANKLALEAAAQKFAAKNAK